ncbi:CitMHS family transporter [Sphingobium sp. GW456-12-10-14-TSB1]|jgi:CitMHS family citrate-Mg2+:H+ or citrate-Ca2+:H+ symporter|uniref:CitMHS family transporter n=1 Tax=Sphingomonadales TaxID=204457 RepID=UPI0026E46443|nr:CitMHS family transporter [Sphingobium sp. GW456-12-10-14-TSB1]
MVITFMVLIMLRRLSPLVALTLVPVLFALVGGFGGAELGKMMLAGITKLAPTGIMLMFAILYFGLMIDAGLFDPVVRRIIRVVDGDPMKILVGTAVLAAVVSLDGDGSTTYMIVTASMLPLFKRINMDPLKLTCVTILAGGIMNLTPWGGPLARATSALHVEPTEVFVPMIPVMAVGVVGVIFLAYVLGMQERRRLAGGVTVPGAIGSEGSGASVGYERVASVGDKALKRPGLLWFNALLTLALLAGLILEVLPLAILFMLGFAVAILVNYPRVAEQRERIASHSTNVLAVSSLIFAAGIFTGILGGTGMVDAMSSAMLALVPPQAGPYLAPIVAVASLPLTFFISNDAFYYGMLPIATHAAEAYGITPVEMARASLIGQPVHLLSPLVPSTYLLVGLAGVEFGDHQRFTLKWATAICMLMLVASLLLGLFPLIGAPA